MQEVQVPHAWGQIEMQANGTGYALFGITHEMNVEHEYQYAAWAPPRTAEPDLVGQFESRYWLNGNDFSNFWEMCFCECQWLRLGECICEDVDECGLGLHDCDSSKGEICVNLDIRVEEVGFRCEVEVKNWTWFLRGAHFLIDLWSLGLDTG